MQNSGVTFKIGSDRAFYSPAFDTIQMPPDVAFKRREYWAATIVYKIDRSTGHPTRMNRDLSMRIGWDAYACEEARVEMAAVFVCNRLNLPTDFESSAAYAAGWLRKLREDKRELLHCAADAEKIADYVLAYHPELKPVHAQAGAPLISQPSRPTRAALSGPSLSFRPCLPTPHE